MGVVTIIITITIAHAVLPAALLSPGCLMRGREDHGQETPKGRRDVQALGREGEWAVGAVGKGRLREDVGSVGMSTWHFVAFILFLCLFHHFYGLVRRHLLKGLFHLDLTEVTQPCPSLNIFFCPRNYINVPFVM